MKTFFVFVFWVLVEVVGGADTEVGGAGGAY